MNNLCRELSICKSCKTDLAAAIGMGICGCGLLLCNNCLNRRACDCGHNQVFYSNDLCKSFEFVQEFQSRINSTVNLSGSQNDTCAPIFGDILNLTTDELNESFLDDMTNFCKKEPVEDNTPEQKPETSFSQLYEDLQPSRPNRLRRTSNRASRDPMTPIVKMPKKEPDFLSDSDEDKSFCISGSSSSTYPSRRPKECRTLTKDYTHASQSTSSSTNVDLLLPSRSPKPKRTKKNKSSSKRSHEMFKEADISIGDDLVFITPTNSHFANDSINSRIPTSDDTFNQTPGSRRSRHLPKELDSLNAPYDFWFSTNSRVTRGTLARSRGTVPPRSIDETGNGPKRRKQPSRMAKTPRKNKRCGITIKKEEDENFVYDSRNLQGQCSSSKPTVAIKLETPVECSSGEVNPLVNNNSEIFLVCDSGVEKNMDCFELVDPLMEVSSDISQRASGKSNISVPEIKSVETYSGKNKWSSYPHEVQSTKLEPIEDEVVSNLGDFGDSYSAEAHQPFSQSNSFVNLDETFASCNDTDPAEESVVVTEETSSEVSGFKGFKDSKCFDSMSKKSLFFAALNQKTTSEIIVQYRGDTFAIQMNVRKVTHEDISNEQHDLSDTPSDGIQNGTTNVSSPSFERESSMAQSNNVAHSSNATHTNNLSTNNLPGRTIQLPSPTEAAVSMITTEDLTSEDDIIEGTPQKAKSNLTFSSLDASCMSSSFVSPASTSGYSSSTPNPGTEAVNEAAVPEQNEKCVISSSCLTPDIKARVKTFARILDYEYTDAIDRKYDILVVSPLNMSTFKYILAIASRAKIVSVSWVYDTARANKLLPVDDYIINDEKGGPQRSLNGAEPPFRGMTIFIELLEDGYPGASAIQQLCELGGARVIRSIDRMDSPSRNDIQFPRFYLFREEQQLTSQVLNKCSTLLAVAISFEWVYDCMQHYKTLPIVNYLSSTIFCSPDLLISTYQVPALLVPQDDDTDIRGNMS